MQSATSNEALHLLMAEQALVLLIQVFISHASFYSQFPHLNLISHQPKTTPNIAPCMDDSLHILDLLSAICYMVWRPFFTTMHDPYSGRQTHTFIINTSSTQLEFQRSVANNNTADPVAKLSRMRPARRICFWLGEGEEKQRIIGMFISDFTWY